MTKTEKITLTLLLILILAVSVHYLGRKSGYYVDEGMTLFLANGHYNGTVTSRSAYDIGDFIRTYVIKEGDGPAQVVGNVKAMLSELTGRGNYSSGGTVGWYDAARSMLQGTPSWISGEELFREITVCRGERFQYGQVCINQALDVHPILYYVAVHTVFSVFAGIYSDAFLFGINILFLMLTCIITYKLVRRCWNDPVMALFAVAVFGLSGGFISCAVYFRMYAMLTFFVMLVLYLHVKLQDDEKAVLGSRKRRLALGMTVWAGFNTHYYFILFMLPVFVITCVRIRKDKCNFWKYIKTMLLTGIISVIFWPFSVYHILFGYRGTEALSNVAASGILDRLYGCVKEFANAFTLGNVMVFAVILVISVAAMIRNARMRTWNAVVTAYMLIPLMGYLVVVAQVAPSVSDRYVMCLFPLVAAIAAYGIMQGIMMFTKSQKAKKMVGTVLTVALFMISVTAVAPNYLYEEQGNRQLGIEGAKADYNCLMLCHDHGQGFREAVRLSEFKNVLVLGRTELDGITAGSEWTDGLVVYVFQGMDVDGALGELSCKAGMTGVLTPTDSDIESFDAYIYNYAGQ